MSILRRIPAVFALLMLGAHFLRAGETPRALLSVALLIPLFIPRTWAQALLRGALGLGALVWLWTAAQGIRTRLAFGEPWLRLALILGAVAAFTGWAAWLLRVETAENKRRQD